MPFLSGILGELTQGRFNSTANDLKAGFLVTFKFHIVQCFLRTDQRSADADHRR
jgi:hypothetical protein